jgi:hypothetical protein
MTLIWYRCGFSYVDRKSVCVSGGHGRNQLRANPIIFLFVVSLFLAAPGIAQSPNGTINGIVLDPSGSVIVGAEITIVNDATGVKYSGKTNNEGIYVVPNLPPGSYRLQVSRIGFKTLIKPDIVLNVQDALAINFTLPIGAASETVTVVGGAPLVNTQSASVSTVIDRQFVEDLPLNGRSFNTLLQLTPGVVIAPSNGNSPGQFSIAGQRTTSNYFSVDGVSANFGVGLSLSANGTGSGQAFSVLGGTSSLVSVEALQEFRVETSSFAPEFGHAPGGQVILTTRSGTNDFHGGIYEYFRNDVMDANDWFADQASIPKAAERHNDFGGYLGGPIFKDKTFFFFSYEGARLRLPQTEITEVPSEFARMTASSQLAPYLNAYPQPNDQTITPGVFTSQFIGSFSNSANLNATSIRIDHRINGRFSLFGRYNYAPSEAVGRPEGGTASSAVLSNLSPTKTNTQTFTVGSDMLLSDKISNAVRANYSTQTASLINGLDSFGGAVPLNASLLLGALPSTKNLGAFLTFDTGLYVLGPTVTNRTAQADVLDDLNVNLGTHQLKFGGDYWAIYLDRKPFNFEATYISPSVESLLTSGTALILQTSAEVPARLRSDRVSLYGQDTWKVSPRLTLTYGLRWEVNPAPVALGRTTLAAWSNVTNPAELALAPSGTPIWRTTYDNFAPRVGLAYQLNGTGDFVVRAGWGLFYDSGADSVGALAQEFPNTVTKSIFNVSLPVGDLTPDLPVISVQPPFPISTAGYSPNLKMPRSYQWNVAIEKSFGAHQVVSATYVGQAGRNLLRQEALFQPNPNFLGDFFLTTNDARSNYNGLQVQYRRPVVSGLQALLNYTWSHSLDNSSNDVVAGLSNTVISAANDYASSDFDVRQSFSGALSYAIPTGAKSGALGFLTKGWSIDSVIVARTGFPLNAVLTSTSPGGPFGFVFSRPDLVSGQPLFLHGSQCASVFQGLGVLALGQGCPGGKGLNPSAFSTPSSVRQGTEGRNDIPGFGLTQIDLSVGRKFPISERVNLLFRADAFNIFNHPNFTNPIANVDTGPPTFLSQQMLNQGLGGLNPLFQEGGPRSLQLSLKLSF